MLGYPTTVRRIEISIGVSPPAHLHVSAFSKGEIPKVNIKNLVEKLNLTENLIIKILDELGLLVLLESKFHYRWITWEVSSSTSKIRSLSYWRKNLKGFVPNKLFPLTEEVLEEDMVKCVFSNGDTIISIPSICLVYELKFLQTTNVPFRFFAMYAKEPKEKTTLFKLLLRINEILLAALTILSFSAKLRNFERNLGEFERNFDNIIEQAKNTKTSTTFTKIEKIEPSFWKLSKEYSTFIEEVDYVSKIVKTRNLDSLTSGLVREISELYASQFGGLIPQLESILKNGLDRLTSEVSILNARFKNFNNEFNSVKTTLATRIQVGLQRQNLSIQNALGLLQIIVVMVFLFEILRYFYPFANDLQHKIAYILVITLPSIFVYIVYRKITSARSKV